MRETQKGPKIKEGWTTGTCASASAKAATMIFLGAKIPQSIEVELPIKHKRACLQVHRAGGTRFIEAFATTIKDAGDDPDVTHGAEIGAIVRSSRERGIKIKGGEGVGRVTKPGLGLEVGEPDITRVPRKMIKDAVLSVIESEGVKENDVAIEVEIFVPEGRERAKGTLLQRLGVIDGIGILGTLGVVIPYSTGAWKAMIAQQMGVARGAGVTTIVGATGRQSEQLARSIFHDLPEISFVDVGDFIGFALKFAERRGMKRFIYAAFPGKLLKFASGHDFTHSMVSSVDVKVFLEISRQVYPHLPSCVHQRIAKANTAREFTEIAKSFGLIRIFEKLAQMAYIRCKEIAGGLKVEILLFDYDGELLCHLR